MKPHRLAEYFPKLEGDEFEQLVKDIDEFGQLEPIIVLDNQILDGVNRYRACQELGIKPKTIKFNGGDPLRYVISANIRRRHLTQSQKAILALELLPLFEEDAKKRQSTSKPGKRGGQSLGTKVHKEKSSEGVAKIFGITERHVVRAKRIQQEAPERLHEIRAGKASVVQVDNELKEAKARERAQARASETNKKERQEKPREVKEYLEALKAFDMALQTAIRVAKYGKFSPEAARFTIRRHSQIRNYLLGFDDILEEINE